MPDFFTNELATLEKKVDNVNFKKSSQNLYAIYEIERCLEWIKTNNFNKVCLQFPDYLLSDSYDIALELQDKLGFPVYILGDTAYESCCIDYIAAAHIDGDAIIHFGPICFSQTASALPYLNIYEKHFIDINEFSNKYDKIFDQNATVCVLVDTPYIDKIDQLKENRNEKTEYFPLENFEIPLSADAYLFIGSNIRKLENICFCNKGIAKKDVYYYDPQCESPTIEKFNENKAILKRRYYLAEKIKDSKTVGIIMGTLTVNNYLIILDRIKNILKKNGKKFYTISVGKINVSKLANFPEMDIYVIITCAMNEVYDSKEFHKPITTPYDIEYALNPDAYNLPFTYNYNSFLDQVAPIKDLRINEECDVSLLTGNLRSCECEDEKTPDGTVALKEDGKLVSSDAFGAGYLASRSWSGLEQNVGSTEPAKIKEGRKGIAQGYEGEVK